MTLDTREARQALAELELVSHGSVQAWDSSGGHSAEKPLLPSGEPNPPHLALRARLQAAQTQTEVNRVTAAAKAALKAARYTPEPTDPEWGSFQWRRQIVREIQAGKRDVKDAMSHYHLSQATIYRYIAAYGQEAA